MERVVSSYHSPRIPIPMNWGTSGTVWVGGNGGANPFSVYGTVDPNSPLLPVQYATGRGGIDGNATVALEAGFTPPVSLVAWEWNPKAQAWFRLGAAAAAYETAFDATYAQNTFQVSENAYILIQSTAAITGNAYSDMMQDGNVVGAPQEGF